MDPHLGQIVVPLDGSELAAIALGPARALAAATGASLRLVTTRWDHDTESPHQYLMALSKPTLEILDPLAAIERHAIVERRFVVDALLDVRLALEH